MMGSLTHWIQNNPIMFTKKLLLKDRKNKQNKTTTTTKRHKEPFGSDKHVNYLDYGDGCTGVYMYKLKLYTLNM